ncbi:CBS domain-containing protein [Mesoaciditoga sp.]
MKVEDFMERDVTAVFADETVEEFIHACVRQFRSGLPVVDDEMRVLGIITERDIIHEIVPSYMEMLHSTSFIPDTNITKKRLEEIKDRPIAEYMQKELDVLKTTDTLLSAATLVLKHGYRFLPVIDEEEHLAGIVTRSVILEALLS